MTPTSARSSTTVRRRVVTALAVIAAMSSFGVGCSTDSDDDDVEPSIPAGGQTGTNPGPTLSPNGLTVPTT